LTSELASSKKATAAPTADDSSPGGAFEFEPHNCFACGSLNEHGLRLDLHLGQRRAWTELTLDPRFEGWAGVAHGGIVATLLDEVMAWSLVAEDNWGVTARMSIDYRRPVPIGHRIRAEGWIVRARRRLVETSARLAGGDGALLATADAVYVAADEQRKRELQARYGYRLRAIRERGPAADLPESVAATRSTTVRPAADGPATTRSATDSPDVDPSVVDR
jgi:uncharacterized protein (TIGR00369 family)